jgi:uncharacterized protein
MQVVDGELVVSPTDLTHFLACRHLVALDLEVAFGRRPAPLRPHTDLDVLPRRGLEHERQHLERLRAAGLVVVEIPTDGDPGTDTRSWWSAEQATIEAMASGADVVYQATFTSPAGTSPDGTSPAGTSPDGTAPGPWRGRADFLLRRDGVRGDGRTGRWPWWYDVADTKLARRLTVPAILQMACYADRLAQLQGIEPELLVVVGGDGRQRPYPFADCAAYARRLRARMQAFVEEPPPTDPQPVPHCAQCRWQPQCRQRWQADDDLTLVAHLRRPQAAALRTAGITTATELAAADPDALGGVLRPDAADRLVNQARLQLHERRTGRPAHRMLPPAANRGLALLPEPSAGDVFFDIEGDPLVGDAGLEYLFGVVHRGAFTGYWATDPGAEQAAFEQLVDHLTKAWADDPGMHVYHYAPYEPSRLKALAGRYDTRVDEVDRLLRGGRLVDLYVVVRQGVQVGKESYSLKRVEDHYWSHHRQGDDVADALGSVVAFERWLTDHDDTLLEGIRAYNELDCRSTQALRDWLEQLRAGRGGDEAFARPQHGDGAPGEAVGARDRRSAQLRDALAERMSAPDLSTELHEGYRLLSGLLDWHRREALPQWSDWFRRRGMSDEELIADAVPVAGLTAARPIGTRGRCVRWELTFPPQETALLAGDADWIDPATGRTVGRIEQVRPDDGVLVLERAAGREPPTCTALIPGGPVGSDDLRARLADLAVETVETGLDGDRARRSPAVALLLRHPPAGLPRRPGESAQDAVLRLGSDPDVGVLPVQGPPGTGKTRTAAELVVHLLTLGRRVGICAFSHSAVGTLLREVAAQARRRGVPLRALQKADPVQACGDPDVARTGRADDVERALADGTADLVAGTPWLFARAGLRDLDTLIVDEAGQLSLANVLAVAGAARSLVLFGDPQQLAQPVQGIHPPGAGASALEHLLGGAATVPPDRGVLLDTTFRMHPRIAAFVSRLGYDGRLGVADGLERQRVASDGRLSGAGLRWVPVRRDPDAADPMPSLVADLVDELLCGGRWIDANGAERRLAPDDVLVLAAHNRQVARLRRAVTARRAAPCGVPVGTVDAMQGRQAPVVFYCLPTGGTRVSVIEPSRGGDFAADLHRLTVALSRARGLVTLVVDEELIDGRPEGVDQLRRLDALCRYRDESLHVVPRPAE